MNADLNSGVSGLGTLTSSFYLGVGIMQVPGGVLAAKWGPKRTVSLGILVSSIAVLGTSISSAILEVATLRFIVGAGMALVFAPSVVLMTRFLGGKSGTGVGLINSAFDIGGLFGLFGWILLATVTGLGSLGSNLGSVLISSFMAYYLWASLGEAAAIAGIVAAMIVVLPIYTSLWGGKLYDRTRKPRRLLVLSGLGMTSALLVAAAPTLTAAAAGAVLGGIAVGPASTINFAAAKDLSRVEKEYEGLTIGWVNSISLTGSFWPPLVFSYFARSFNYSAAWIAGAVMCFLLLVPLLFLREEPSKFAKVS